MDSSTFRHLSAFVDPRQLGLGWLAGVSVMETDRAVTTDWHRHETTELLFCLRGETQYEFRNRPSVTLCAGSYLVVPAGVEHRVSNAIDEPGKRIGLNLRRTSEPTRRFAVFAPKDYLRFRQRLEANAFSARLCLPEMKRAVVEIDRLARISPLSSAECGYLRIQCCSVLYAAVLPSAPKAAPAARMMDEAVKWLEAHLAEKVTVDRLAAYMGYSRARLFTLFRERTGLSPNDYLQRIRIRKAKELLTSGNDSARTVAAACGFSDSRYFSHVFKQLTGDTPLGYRTRTRTGDTRNSFAIRTAPAVP